MSKYARSTYGRERKPAARIALRTASLTLIDVRNAFVDHAGAMMSLSSLSRSPSRIRSSRYAFT